MGLSPHPEPHLPGPSQTGLSPPQPLLLQAPPLSQGPPPGTPPLSTQTTPLPDTALPTTGSAPCPPKAHNPNAPIRTPSHRPHPCSKAPLRPAPPLKAPPQTCKTTPLWPHPSYSRSPPPPCPSPCRPRPSRPGSPASLLHWPLGGRGAGRRGAGRAPVRLREARRALCRHRRSGKAHTRRAGLPPAGLRCPSPATLLSAAAPRPARPLAGGCFLSAASERGAAASERPASSTDDRSL